MQVSAIAILLNIQLALQSREAHKMRLRDSRLLTVCNIFILRLTLYMDAKNVKTRIGPCIRQSSFVGRFQHRRIMVSYIIRLEIRIDQEVASNLFEVVN